MSSRGISLFLFLVICWTIADARRYVRTDIIVTEVVIEGPEMETQVLERNDEVCMVCENFTSQAITYLSENKTQDQIIETLHLACSQIKSFEQQCIMLVDYYAILLFNEISKIKPEDFCKEVNLCESSMSYYHSTLPKSDSTCVFCRHMIEEVLTKLQDPDSQLEIIEILLKECNNIENHVQECKRMVLQYGPLILVNGEKFLEKNDICTVVHACNSNQKQSILSVTEDMIPLVVA